MMFTFPLLLTIYAGFTHAFETDHLLAVSSIVSRRDHIWISMKDGIFWGLGHSSTILFIGVLMIVFKVSIAGGSFHYFEAGVGLMLIVLAMYRIVKFITTKKSTAHNHTYNLSGIRVHGQLKLVAQQPQHVHFGPVNVHTHDHSHKLAYGVGLVHGLAGSGVLIVLVMAQIKSPLDGLVYLLVFCTGCIVGMLLAAGLFSVPFSQKIIQAPGLQNILVVTTCVLSLIYGGRVIYENML